MGKRYRSWGGLLLMCVLGLLEVQLVESAALKLNECELNNYSPCRCSQNEQGVLIFCEELHPAQVQNVFNQSKSTMDLHFFYLSPSKTASSYQITSDVLSGRRTEFIQIECPSTKNQNLQLQIDADAFRSTSTKTTNFDIRDCDLSRLDFNFLRGFNRLKSFTIESCNTIEHSIRTLPVLPALEQLDISMSNGLADSSFRNLDEVALGTLKLEDNDDLNDNQIENILKSLTTRSTASLRSLQLAGNQLTVVPSQVALFTQLNSINLENNKITHLIDGQFKFEVPVSRLHLSHNSISSIASGAFQGNFGSARVFLMENNLTRFEESVFKAMLLQMFTGNGKLYIDTNPFHCDCHLAWLIRDNRELLKVVEGGKCANGTKFDRLNRNGFDDCQAANRSVLPENSTLAAPENSPVTPSAKEEDKATFETRSMIDNSTSMPEMISTTEITLNQNMSDVMSATHATEKSLSTANIEPSETVKVESTTSFESFEKSTTMNDLDMTPPSIEITRDVTEKSHQMTKLLSNQQASLTNDTTSIIQPDLMTNSTFGVPASQVMTAMMTNGTTPPTTPPPTVSIGTTITTSEPKTAGFTMVANGPGLSSLSTSTEMPSSSEPSAEALATNPTTLSTLLTATEMTSISEPTTAGLAASGEMPVSAAITTSGTSVSSVTVSTEISTTSEPSTGSTAMATATIPLIGNSTEIGSTLQPGDDDTKDTMKPEELSTTSVAQQSELAATSDASTTEPAFGLIQTTENAVTATLLSSVKGLTSDEPTTDESRASDFQSSAVASDVTTLANLSTMPALTSSFETNTTRLLNDSTLTRENAPSLFSTESTPSISSETVQTTESQSMTTFEPTSSTISNLNLSVTTAATDAPSTAASTNVTLTPTTQKPAKTSSNSNSVISTSTNVTFSAPSGTAEYDVPSPIVGASGVIDVRSSSLMVTANQIVIALVAVINLLAR